MKKLIVCLTFAAFTNLSLRAGENCTEKTAAVKAQTACCATQAKAACASKAATAAKKATTMKGAQLLARR